MQKEKTLFCLIVASLSYHVFHPFRVHAYDILPAIHHAHGPVQSLKSRLIPTSTSNPIYPYNTFPFPLRPRSHHCIPFPLYRLK
ncbi:hypothetical protein EYC84_011899 [Monilinia fructicola]|uniref:Uncharacterized protein n=1 Tax=Monilinia fructicola TaxID=38448 RepID=A0A5M9J8C1_MONFR|nr:hypothetical protein EYC84_011899 [Monilinia fructicola]